MSSDYDEEIDWNKVMEKEAMGENGLDLGTIKQIEDDYIVTEMGGLTKKTYKLPKSEIKSFNGVFLNFSLNESDASAYMLKDDTVNISTTTDSLTQSVGPGLQEEEREQNQTLVPLVGEDIQVTKKIVEDNIKISKEPLKETKTIEIDLMHEKITIEKRAIDNNDNTYNSKFKSVSGLTNGASSENDVEDKESVYSKTELLIPIKREEPVITKRSFVKEEIVVKKKPVTETKTITEEVVNEEMEYINTTE
jgi:stress response protein YsnF